MSNKLTVKSISRIEAELDAEISYVNNKLNFFPEGGHFDTVLALSLDKINTVSARLQKLIEAKFAIRSAKALFNEASGINKRTIEIAKLNLTLKFYEAVERLPHVYGQTNYTTNKVTFIGGINEKWEEHYRVQRRLITRQIQSFKDSCAGINAAGIVELPEDVLDVLKEFGML